MVRPSVRSHTRTPEPITPTTLIDSEGAFDCSMGASMQGKYWQRRHCCFGFREPFQHLNGFGGLVCVRVQALLDLCLWQRKGSSVSLDSIPRLDAPLLNHQTFATLILRLVVRESSTQGIYNLTATLTLTFKNQACWENFPKNSNASEPNILEL